MRHNEIDPATFCAFTMFLTENKTTHARGISQLCVEFMVNALALLSQFGVLLNEISMLIRDMLKNTERYAKASRIPAFAIAHRPSKLRRYKFLAEINKSLPVGITQLVNQKKRGTEA